MKMAKRVFTIAGIYGILVLLPQYFMEDRVGRDFPPPITHPENFYGFIGTALAFQVVFLIIGRDPARYRLAMIPAMLEKLAFAIPVLVLYSQGRLPVVVLVFGLIDLVLCTLFFACYRATKITE